MAEFQPLAQVSLRLPPEDAARVATVIVLPLEPNTATSSGELEALWLGPDEWLVVGAHGAQQQIIASLQTALDGVHHSVVDMSANRIALDLGPTGPELLAAGCTLDLHPRAWLEGRCAQTLIGPVPAIIQERADGTRVFVRPSYAAWFTDWLAAIPTL